MQRHLEVCGNITEMNQVNNLADCESFKSKIKITGKTPTTVNEKEVEIMVPLKYLSNFWRTLEMP